MHLRTLPVVALSGILAAACDMPNEGDFGETLAQERLALTECSTVEYSPGTSYWANQVVTYNGQNYTARWWTQQNPEQNNGPDYSGKPWTEPAPCGGGQEPPDECDASISPWSANQAYWAGDVVSYHGKSYTARWWNQAMNPEQHTGPEGSGRPWTLPTVCDTDPPPDSCTTGTPWSQSATYLAGDVVHYKGNEYTARWWTLGQNPEQHSGPGRVWTAPEPCAQAELPTITPVLFVPSDESVTEAERDAVASALCTMEAWYESQLDGRSLRIGALEEVDGGETAAWYLENVWGHATRREISDALGYGPDDSGHIIVLIGAGLQGWAGGNGTATTGYAVLGLESLTRPAACEPNWWCHPDVWVGTAAHELGHALQLPHSAPPSVMNFHGDFPNVTLIETPEWPEVSTVRASLFSEDIADDSGHCASILN